MGKLLFRLGLAASVVLLAFIPPRSYPLEKLNSRINSAEYDEISPVMSADGKTLYFTRVGAPEFNKTLIIDGEDVSKLDSENFFIDQLSWVYDQIAGAKVEDPVHSSLNQDIWSAKASGNTFYKVNHLAHPLNDALPNSVCAIVKNGKELIVMNQFEPKGGMRPGFSKVTMTDSGAWSFPKPIQIEAFEQNGGEVSMYTSNAETTMILSLSDPERGDNDLYVSSRIGTNMWSQPINLGDNINSKHREVTPFLSDDNRTLYFASNRPGSIGGMDIYYSVRQGNGWQSWSEPRKFYYPINTKYDDSQPMFNTKTGYLYFSSRRDGSSDIFRSEIGELDVLNYAFETVDVSGKVVNKENNVPVSAEIVVRLKKEDKVFTRQKVNNGHYTLKIPKGVDIEVNALKDGYITHVKHFSFRTDTDYQVLTNINLFLEPIRKGNKIGNAPIFFKSLSPEVLPGSMPELRRLAQILINNPTLAVVIQGHTDKIGSSDHRLRLSLDRAQAVEHYFIQQGIAQGRLSSEAMGSKYPLGTNASEAERKKNRRVEIKVGSIEQSSR